MPSQILVAYQCGEPTGEIVAIVDELHVFSPQETLSSWEMSAAPNDRSNWNRNFTLVRVTDKTKEELGYLTEPLMLPEEDWSVDPETGQPGPETDPSGLRKWHFAIPPEGSGEYNALNQYGEIECPFSVCMPLLIDRAA